MSVNKETASSSSSGDAHAKKSLDKLNVREFRECFCIPNGVLVELMDGEAMATEKYEDNAIFFTNEQFNAGLRFPLPSLFKEFLHFTQIPPAYIHPNMVRVLMGCSILSMLFNLDLSLLEGGTKGHVLVRGAWAGLLEHLERPFSPNSSLALPGPDKRGRVVEWVEKALFARLNKLFEITATKRHYETLLTARNLLAVVQEPQAYVINILPRKLPKNVVSEEHYVLKDLPFYKEVRKTDAEKHQALLDNREGMRKEETLRKAPGKKRSVSSIPAGAPAKKKNKRKLALNKGKEIKLSTPPKDVVIPPSTFVKEITIRESDHPVLPSVSSGSGRLVSLNHSRPSVPVAGRLALLVEEATSVNQPGSPHPDLDAARASYADALPPSAPPTEETGAKSQGLPPCEPSPLAFVPVKGLATKRSRPAYNLKSGLIRRLQDRFLETIEVNCSSIQDDHPKESETEMAVENPTAPVVVSNGGSPGETQPAKNDGAPDPGEESLPNASSKGSPIDDATCISASPFSYAELGEMLKRIPSGSDVVVPSAKIFEVVEMLVSGIRDMAQ
ncbi:hypothetical protein VitviT2T_009861 [Vitis vinifera]|uniref:Aminotransferase-like plant mobile domain-containing protein n=1 Tax=Vitis vinifera TaxID=29760 RepID=A0ABY9C642_VITVI|nr:hypothetical protein VitviT2T_009861 [Vitis vinifera]